MCRVFLCNVKFIGLHKNVQALFGLLKDKLKCLLHLFKKKNLNQTRSKKKKSPNPIVTLYMKILVSVRSLMINLSFCLQKMKPFMVKKKKSLVSRFMLGSQHQLCSTFNFLLRIRSMVYSRFKMSAGGKKPVCSILAVMPLEEEFE